MADVNISKYRASVVREGSKPATPGFVVSEGQDPVNPPGTNNFVPYTGATANVELGEFGIEAGFVTLDTTPTNIPTDQGAIYWDDTRSTAALIMNGTLQHIGQDSFFYVKNSSGSTIPKGTCVGFAGTDGGSGHLLVTPFLANGSVPSTYFMGVTAEAIANGSFGQVMHFGELTGINTSGFTAGALLYASTTVAGAFQTTAPVAPNNIILVAAAVNSKNNGAIVVRPTLGSNINLDEGVKITSPTTGDLLQLQAGGLWENKTLAQVIGSAYVPSTRTITINATAFDLSANRSWTVGDVRTDGSYSNPSWITALAWSKITGTPTTLSGYGITDAVPNSRTITINGVTQDLSANRSFNVGTVTSVGLSSATSGVTIGSTPVTSSGTITLAIATATATQNGLLSSTDWSTFNNKQNALTNPVTGTGTTNYLAKFTGSTTIGNSQIFDNGTNVGIGTASPSEKLDVIGVLRNLMPSDPLSGMITAKFLSFSPNPYGIHFRGYASGVHSIQVQREGNNSELFGLSLQPLGGNVLIGTTTDNGARLQVNGSIRSGFANTSALLVQSNGTATTGAAIAIQQLTGEGDTIIFGDYEPFAEYGIIARNSLDSIDFTGGTTNGSLDNYNITNRSGNVRTAYVKARIGLGSGITAFGGSVGIGTTSPATRLMVQDTANTYVAHFSGLNQANGIAIGTNFSNVAVIQGYTRTFSATNNISMQADGGNVLIGTTTDLGQRLQVSGSIYLLNGGNRNIRIGSATNYFYDLQTTNDDFQIIEAGATPRLTIKYPNGNVGIGTSSPSGLLHVKSSGAYGSLLVDNTGTTGGGYFASLQNGSTRGIIAVTGAIEGNTTSDFGMFAETGGALRFYVNGSATRVMSLTSGGNLLVGTTSDNGARLQVSGRINATGGGSNGVLVSSNSGSVTIPTTGLSLNTGFNVGYLQNFNGGNYVDLYYGASKHIFDGGNVGIGTATFAYSPRLAVASVGQNSIAIQTTDTVQGSAGTILYLGTGSSTGSSTYGQIVPLGNGGTSAANLVLQPTGSNGNVLIGTTTDNSHKLRVNGTGYFDTGIKTGNPVGSTTNDWLLGRALVSGTSTPDRWIRVQIGNLYYDILAVYMGSV